MMPIDSEQNLTSNSTEFSKEIFVYSVRFSDFNQDQKTSFFFEILSKQEQEQSLRFVTKELREQYLISHGILRCILAWHLKEKPQQISYAFNAFGKPELPNQNSLKFNMSHSKDLAVYAVSFCQRVGIDVEWKNPTVRFEDFFADILTDSEKNFLLDSCTNHKMKTEFFFDLWSKKEALIKAIGKGLSYNVKTIQTASKKDPIFLLDGQPFSCSQLPIHKDYACAIAVDQTMNANLSEPLLTIQALSDCHPIVSVLLQ